MYTGGKGGNQAVAAAKLGADVMMAGCLGDDSNAGIYRALMKELHIRDQVRTVPGLSSGTALIEVSSSGENRIVVVSGANMAVDTAMIDEYEELISESEQETAKKDNTVEIAIGSGIILKNIIRPPLQ